MCLVKSVSIDSKYIAPEKHSLSIWYCNIITMMDLWEVLCNAFDNGD